MLVEPTEDGAWRSRPVGFGLVRDFPAETAEFLFEQVSDAEEESGVVRDSP